MVERDDLIPLRSKPWGHRLHSLHGLSLLPKVATNLLSPSGLYFAASDATSVTHVVLVVVKVVGGRGESVMLYRAVNHAPQGPSVAPVA